MIVVDASAILSIVLKEADAEVFETALIAAGEGIMSPVNYWEVLVRAWSEFGAPGHEAAKGVMDRLCVTVQDITSADAEAAAKAFQRFGKGTGGKLNLGDCFAYALAHREGEGLLFKGDDFPKTDVKSALA